MSQPGVKLTLRGGAKESSEEYEFVPEIGAKLEFKLADKGTSVSLDYKSPENIKIRVDGKMTFMEVRGIKIKGGVAVSSDFKKEHTYEGVFEVIINKNIATDIKYIRSPEGDYIGAGFSISF